MASIATVEDVETRIGRELQAEDSTRVQALLDDASSMIRSITGRPFGTLQVTRRILVRRGLVNLGNRDISAIASVKLVDGTEIDAAWDGLSTLSIGAFHQFDLEAGSARVVEVAYTRTGGDAPQWVVAIVAQMAARAYGRPADTTGLQQEAIAGYSYTVGQAAAAGGVGLLPVEEKRLREAYPRLGATAWLGVSC